MLLGFGRGMQNGVMDDFGSDVLDFIIVWTGDTSVAYRGMGPGRKIQLHLADIEAVRQQIPGIRLISAERFAENGNVNYGRKISNGQILGVPDEYFRVKEDVPFNFGRKVNPLDLDETRKVVVIGTAVAERLFAKGEDPVGKQVRVKDVVMKVVGVFYDKGGRGQKLRTGAHAADRPWSGCMAAARSPTTSGCGPRRASTDSNSRRRCSRC